MITKEEEFALIDRVLAGQTEAYAQLVDAYKSFAFTIALKVLENRPEAEEAAQDAFIRAFHYLKKFNREARFSTWLYRITFNTAISAKRKSKVRMDSIENKMMAYEGAAEESLERNDKQVFIAQAMEKLNEADKLSIQLYYLQEFSLEEVAEIMGQPSNTIKVRVHRARLRLAEELTKILKSEVVNL
ncbi:MAG: sigma-70 family RNA polymerase sigma factor [Cyclobacteriaceae bacterium]|nr:sigma-70 family RNA polymerase sigma factor [Cyclobacteriaceae bacterium]